MVDASWRGKPEFAKRRMIDSDKFTAPCPGYATQEAVSMPSPNGQKPPALIARVALDGVARAVADNAWYAGAGLTVVGRLAVCGDIQSFALGFLADTQSHDLV